MIDCPLCTIPDREIPLYIDDDLYLIPTKDLKGHRIRVMICTRKHKKNFSFHEQTRAYSILINYMQDVMPPGETWFIVEGRYATYKDHAHIIACDFHCTPEEYTLLLKTPRVIFPLPKWIPKKKILVGIPAFNEEETISSIVTKAKQHGDVLVIDDGSTDNTLKEAVSAGATYTKHKTKQGYGTSLQKIFTYAKLNNYDILITLDADGQHNPDEIPTFLQALEKGADIVIGNRFMGKSKVPAYRKFGIKTVSVALGISDAQCGFRAFNRKAINTIKIKERGMGASLETLTRAKEANLKITEVPCKVHYDQKTTHTQHPLTHGSKLLETILWSRVWSNPFKYLGILGIISFLVGLVSTLQLMNIYIQYREFVLSWTFLSLGGLFGGVLLLTTSALVYLLRRGLEEMK